MLRKHACLINKRRLVQFQDRQPKVPWCNGSARVLHTFGGGSIPSGTTKHLWRNGIRTCLKSKGAIIQVRLLSGVLGPIGGKVDTQVSKTCAKACRFDSYIGYQGHVFGFDRNCTLTLQVSGGIKRKKPINAMFIKNLFSNVKAAFQGFSVEIAFEVSTSPQAAVSLA